MKKFTFLAMFIAIGAMTFTSCQKKDTAAEPKQPAEKTAMTFYAVPNGGERTGLDGALNSVWTEGDQIKIFTMEDLMQGGDGDVFTLSKGAGTDYGEFTGKSTESTMYMAMYPKDMASVLAGFGPCFDLPQKQKYAVNSHATNSVPVIAQSESKELVFYNTVGLLRLGVKLKSGDNTVSSMILKDKSNTVKLWGKFVVNEDYSLVYYSDYQGNVGDNTITMDLGTTGVELSSSNYTYFYFCLPVGTLASGFTIEMEDADGKTAIIEHTGSDKAVEIGKGKTLEVADVEFKASSSTTGEAEITGGTKVKWTQLWENGPKFAEYNVGTTSVGEYDGYYTWGGSYKNGEGITWKDDHNEGEDPLTGDSDTATKLWGSKWRMPTKEEFDELLANCDVQWTTNYNGTGKAGRVYTSKTEGYTDNSVFFPAAGVCYGGEVLYAVTNGVYWSSTPHSFYSGCVYALGFDSSDQLVNYYGERGIGYSVRAVLAE